MEGRRPRSEEEGLGDLTLRRLDFPCLEHHLFYYYYLLLLMWKKMKMMNLIEVFLKTLIKLN